MKYERFEDVPVWTDGTDLSVGIFEITEDKSFRFKGDIANQIQRAGLSVPNNIAEGFERGTTQELIAFLYYARGSAGEVRSILCVCERMQTFAHLKSHISNHPRNPFPDNSGPGLIPFRIPIFEASDISRTTHERRMSTEDRLRISSRSSAP